MPETSLATASESATKTFLQSPTATPDSAARSRAKVLTLGMDDWGLGQHDCETAASAATTTTTTVRAQCFKTRQRTNGAVSPGIGAAARSCWHSRSILLTERAERRGYPSCDINCSKPTVSVCMRGTSRQSGPLLNGCTTPRYIAPTSRRYSLSWDL